jgi:hypothetical protein
VIDLFSSVSIPGWMQSVYCIFFIVHPWLDAIGLISSLSIPGWMQLVYFLHCPSLAGCNWSNFFIVHPWLDSIGLFSSLSIPGWMQLVYFLHCPSLAGCNWSIFFIVHPWLAASQLVYFLKCPSLAGCNEFTCHRRLFDMILQDHRQLPVCIVRVSFSSIGSLKTRGLMNGFLELVSNYIEACKNLSPLFSNNKASKYCQNN